MEIYDLDGVVHRPELFFRDELGVDLSSPRMDGSPEPSHEAIIRIAGPGLIVLVGLGRSDGLMTEGELQVILDYAAHRADQAGISMGEADRGIIAAYLRRQFPTDDQIESGLSWIDRETDEGRRLFLRHARKLAEDDGVIVSEEFAILARI